MSEQLICFEWAMKILLRKEANFGILEGFLSELLLKDIKIIEVLDNTSAAEAKFNKIDILAKLDNNEMALIEIQTSNDDDYFYHMLSGASRVVTEYLKKARPDYRIKKKYVINILYHDDLSSDDYVYQGTTSYVGINNYDKISLTEQQKLPDQNPDYYLIKVQQFKDVILTTLDEWIYFFKNRVIENEFSAKGLLEAKEKLSFSALPETEKQEYNKLEMSACVL